MSNAIRTASLRHALNDLRTLHHKGEAAGVKDWTHGAHLPKEVRLDDGSLLKISNLERPGGGVHLGVFGVLWVTTDGKKKGPYHIP